MNVIHRPGELVSGPQAVCAAIGMFDGVHLGHQQILGQTVADARELGATSVAITFDQHPNTVVAPEKTPLLISPLSQRLAAIGAQGIDTTWLIHFDKAFSQQSGEAFVTKLAADFGKLQSISIGRNFSFGHKRSGNVALLKTLSRQFDFVVHDLPAISWGGRMISSTRIREALKQGDLDAAGAMLGRPYSIAGTVLRGEQLGRRLGFPTANVSVAGLQLPPCGVYAGRVVVGERTYEAVANLGYRPTLSRPQPLLAFEVHLLDYIGDLYDQVIEFVFVKKVRAEVKFPSLDALQYQIGQDVAAARALLKALLKG